MKHRLLVHLFLATTLVTGCAGRGHRHTSQPAHDEDAAQQVVKHARPAQPAEQAAAPVVLLRKGTTIQGKLLQTLDSGKNKNDDTFTLKTEGLTGKQLAGAVIEGHVEGVKSAAMFGKKGELDVVFDDLKTRDGQTLPLEGRLAKAPKAQGKKLRNVAIVLGAAVAGHHLAKAKGKKHGALMGAAAGAAVALSLPGGNVVIKKGAPIEVKLTADVVQ